ncbi:MAG: tRNA lysidine(34) synthetase TilS [Planctomycetota bacterium]|nr:tRNA lysidine(34) synthetase TilS [Planctomycetota bacterium]
MKTDDPSKFVARVGACIRAHGLLAPEAGAHDKPEPVVVGVSGGADSVALVLALHDLGRSGLAVALTVAHLHHGLRETTADEDQSFVENLAKRLGLPCITQRLDVLALAARDSVGVEEAARNARRRFLIDAARRAGARKVALGHTADDRAETVLFNILRGTGIEGLAALGPRAPLAPDEAIEIIRPLVDLSRAEVRAFLEARGQAWREDETNEDPAFARNRLRREVLPLLREAANPKVDEALLRLADQAADAADVLQDAVEAVWRQTVRETPTTDCHSEVAAATEESRRAADFALLRPWLQGAILRRAVERLGGGLKHMSAERTRAAVEALLAKSVAGPVELPGGLSATRRRRAIRIGPRGKGTGD